jgi:hypothetical protein
VPGPGRVEAAERGRAEAQQVQCTDDLATKAQRHALHPAEPVPQGLVGEHRPTITCLLEIGGVHLLTAAEGIETGPVAVLDLEQLEEPCAFARRGDRLEVAGRGCEEDTGFIDPDQCDTALAEVLQEVDDVVVVDQGVGEPHERLHDGGFPTEVIDARLLIHRGPKRRAAGVVRPRPPPRRRAGVH